MEKKERGGGDLSEIETLLCQLGQEEVLRIFSGIKLLQEKHNLLSGRKVSSSCPEWECLT